MLADLSQYFTDDELSGYVDEYIAEGRLEQPDALKIFPIAKSTELMMVNATDWDKFAAAENVTADDLSTWEGIVTTSEKYYNYTDALTPDIPDDGKAFFGRDSIANYIVIGAMQLGHPIAADDGIHVGRHLEVPRIGVHGHGNCAGPGKLRLRFWNVGKETL